MVKSSVGSLLIIPDRSLQEQSIASMILTEVYYLHNQTADLRAVDGMRPIIAPNHYFDVLSKNAKSPFSAQIC